MWLLYYYNYTSLIWNINSSYLLSATYCVCYILDISYELYPSQNPKPNQNDSRYTLMLCSVGAYPEHRGRGEQEDRRGGVPVLQAGSQLPRGESEATRDPAVPLPLLPRRAQEQQGPGSGSLLSLIYLWVVSRGSLMSLMTWWIHILTDWVLYCNIHFYLISKNPKLGFIVTPTKMML